MRSLSSDFLKSSANPEPPSLALREAADDYRLFTEENMKKTRLIIGDQVYVPIENAVIVNGKMFVLKDELLALKDKQENHCCADCDHYVFIEPFWGRCRLGASYEGQPHNPTSQVWGVSLDGCAGINVVPNHCCARFKKKEKAEQ
jgi:hypothetical protein